VSVTGTSGSYNNVRAGFKFEPAFLPTTTPANKCRQGGKSHETVFHPGHGVHGHNRFGLRGGQEGRTAIQAGKTKTGQCRRDQGGGGQEIRGTGQEDQGRGRA